MTCAVRVPDVDSVYFLTEPPDDRAGLDVEEGAWIDIPPNVHAWPPGVEAPEQVLCRSSHDPKHYKLFKYREEVDGDEWEPVGLFGGTFSKESWSRFASRLDSLRALHAVPGEGGA
jgi:hypothetical protein